MHWQHAVLPVLCACAWQQAQEEIIGQKHPIPLRIQPVLHLQVGSYQQYWGGVSGGVEGNESLLHRALQEVSHAADWQTAAVWSVVDAVPPNGHTNGVTTTVCQTAQLKDAAAAAAPLIALQVVKSLHDQLFL